VLRREDVAIDEKQIEKIVRGVVENLFASSDSSGLKTSSLFSSGDGLFDRIEDAISAAKVSQKRFVDLGREIRYKIVDSIRKDSLANKDRLARMAVEETKMGRVEDKIRKNEVGALFTPGPEELELTTYSDENGIITIEGAPFGVIAAITPMTNPVPTIINNTISMISAGNSVVYLPHPSAHNSTLEIFKIVHKAIVNAGGPANLITAAKDSKIENAATIFKSNDVDLIVVTGGPGIVRLAMKSGKRVMGAGPGNPPVIVDDTANVEKAAADIMIGATFDNNILCNEEKVLICMRSVADRLLQAFSRNKTVVLNDSQAEKVVGVVVKDGEIVKSYMGKDCNVILKAAGIEIDPSIRLAVFIAKEDHPMVQHEQLMPVLPMVVVDSFDEAVAMAVRVEHGFKHTAVIHSNNIERITRFGQAINTTILVVNGPSQSLAADVTKGGTTWTIAGATGEGNTSPKTFVRQRRLVVNNAMNFVK
jgi:propionaldehyde dehydrogenase